MGGVIFVNIHGVNVPTQAISSYQLGRLGVGAAAP